MRRAGAALAAALGTLAASATSASLAPASGQEMDRSIFHYSLLEVDAASSPGPAVGRWEGAGWIGTDFDRVWWSTAGERAAGEVHDAEATVLYGHYARRFWDLVVGYQHEIEPTSQGYLALGVMGLAPYWFEVSLLGRVSTKGKPSIVAEAENDLFVTQRLILQLAGHVDWLIGADDVLDRAAGIDELELGVRLRYEIRRKFAPYVDMTWVRERDPRTPVAGEPETEGLRWGAGLRLIY